MSSRDTFRRYAKRIPLFNGLDPDEVAHLMKNGEVFNIPKGKTIFHKGQGGDSVFVVLSGSVDIYNEQNKIGRCRVGDAFGEIAALDHRPHTATAVAATEVKLFSIREAQINEYLEQEHAVRFLLNVIHLLSGYIVNSNHRMGLLERKLAEYEKKYGTAESDKVESEAGL